MTYFHSLYSEWLKTKHSIAFWLSIIGGFFIPFIYLIGFIYNKSSINAYDNTINIWEKHFYQAWEFMIILLLPIGVILASSLIAQMEFKNNTWKQLHTTPQRFTTIYFAKLNTIILLTLQFFIFFNIGIILSGVLPCWIVDGNAPRQTIPYMLFLKENIKFFIGCLPIIAIQYLISLQFKNFLAPIGIGILALVGTLIATKWKYIFLSPYSYNILIMQPNRKLPYHLDLHLYMVLSFALMTIIGYILYISKKEKS